MPTCVRCLIEGDDVVMHNKVWVHRNPSVCFKKLRDVVISLMQQRATLRVRVAELEGDQAPVEGEPEAIRAIIRRHTTKEFRKQFDEPGAVITSQHTIIIDVEGMAREIHALTAARGG